MVCTMNGARKFAAVAAVPVADLLLLLLLLMLLLLLLITAHNGKEAIVAEGCVKRGGNCGCGVRKRGITRFRIKCGP